MKLEEGRRIIDAIDTEIMTLLNRRAHISRRIGGIKARAGLPIADANREEDVMRKIIRENEGEIADQALVGIYREILQESRRIQDAVVLESKQSEAQTK
ncbi:MAG TPA: chorismate mutase [Pyrinomonadaceae bacterium]|nr:chorismate mutase [Pyrinomonadaceae bacterium]